MTTPSLTQPWVLISNGKAPPALARITQERLLGSGFFCDLMIAEINSYGVPTWRKRFEHSERAITAHDVLFVFPFAPDPAYVAEARRALRRRSA
jgi:hypothetical protein